MAGKYKTFTPEFREEVAKMVIGKNSVIPWGRSGAV